MKKLFLSFLLIPMVVPGSVNFDTLTPNTWAQIPTSGQYPNTSIETHLAFDTSGNAYMIGSCSYGGSAAGTHNNDVFRFQIRTGITAKLYGCGTNPWPGGCQAGQVFDPSRNCIWFGPGANAKCQTGIVWFPGKAYYGGLYRMQCPGGPLEMIRDTGLTGRYYLYDPVNDLVIAVGDNGYHGCKLSIYDVKKDSIYTKTSPFNFGTDRWHIPCCFDTKRGLVVLTRWGSSDTSTGARSIWFYNTTTKTWTSKTPAVVPPPMNVPLVYDPLADKYVSFGTDLSELSNGGDWHPQVWAYDYDSNTWTQRPRGNLHFDSLNQTASSWPPLRTYPGSFGYSIKDNVLVNWGGLPTGGPPAGPKEPKHPIWTFKLGEQGTASCSGISTHTDLSVLTVQPNPFNPIVVLKVSTPLKAGESLRIFDMSGRVIADLTKNINSGQVAWDATYFSAGIYLAALHKDGASLTRRLVLAR